MARVRQQRDAVQPRQATDVELWRLTKGAHIAAAAVRGWPAFGLELRLPYDGELRRSALILAPLASGRFALPPAASGNAREAEAEQC